MFGHDFSEDLVDVHTQLGAVPSTGSQAVLITVCVRAENLIILGRSGVPSGPTQVGEGVFFQEAFLRVCFRGSRWSSRTWL